MADGTLKSGLGEKGAPENIEKADLFVLLFKKIKKILADWKYFYYIINVRYRTD